ncbi:MAG: hypothetical protein OEZ36_09760, partial [Spirochaetota bacterium]|nr:hypothetical protein [Spirochaetota bacterium]
MSDPLHFIDSQLIVPDSSRLDELNPLYEKVLNKKDHIFEEIDKDLTLSDHNDLSGYIYPDNKALEKVNLLSEKLMKNKNLIIPAIKEEPAPVVPIKPDRKKNNIIRYISYPVAAAIIVVFYILFSMGDPENKAVISSQKNNKEDLAKDKILSTKKNTLEKDNKVLVESPIAEINPLEKRDKIADKLPKKPIIQTPDAKGKIANVKDIDNRKHNNTPINNNNKLPQKKVTVVKGNIKDNKENSAISREQTDRALAPPSFDFLITEEKKYPWKNPVVAA